MKTYEVINKYSAISKEEMVFDAVLYGAVRILKRIFELYGDTLNKETLNYMYNNGIFEQALEEGNIEIIKFMHKLRKLSYL